MAGRQGKETTPTADIYEGFVFKGGHFEKISQQLLGNCDALLINDCEKFCPVYAEREPVPSAYFRFVIAHITVFPRIPMVKLISEGVPMSKPKTEVISPQVQSSRNPHIHMGG